MRRVIITSSILLSGLLLVSCGKNEKGAAGTSDDCAKVKATPPYQTYEQAVEDCRSRHSMSAQPDPKASNTPISNK